MPRFVDNNALLTAIRRLRLSELYTKIDCPEVQIKRMFALPVIRQLAARSKLVEHRVLQRKVLVIKVALSAYNCCPIDLKVNGKLVEKGKTPVRDFWEVIVCIVVIDCTVPRQFRRMHLRQRHAVCDISIPDAAIGVAIIYSGCQHDSGRLARSHPRSRDGLAASLPQVLRLYKTWPREKP